jgi:hypothetical protein
MMNALLPRLLLAAASLYLPSLAVHAAQTGGNTICIGHYALCSHAQCDAKPNAQGKVQCNCIQPGPNLNIGNSTCQQREDTEQPVSTFSVYDLAKIREKPAMKAFHCAGKYKNRWAFCLDAKCTPNQDKTDDKNPKPLQCACTLNKKSSDFYVLTDNCNQKPETLCSQTWSAASKSELESGHKQLAKFYAYPAALEYCSQGR